MNMRALLDLRLYILDISHIFVMRDELLTELSCSDQSLSQSYTPMSYLSSQVQANLLRKEAE